MVGVGGCPCARRERERQRRREEVGWVWVVVVVAGLCRRSFVELRRGGTVGLGVSLRSSPRVRRVPPESESGLQRGGGAALPCLVITCVHARAGEGKCVVRGCVARVRLSRARARWWEGARCCRARCGAACGTHPCRAPPCVPRRERNAQGPRRGGAFSRSRGRTEAAERRAATTKRGGVPFFVCGRSGWCCVVGVCGF